MSKPGPVYTKADIAGWLGFNNPSGIYHLAIHSDDGGSYLNVDALQTRSGRRVRIERTYRVTLQLHEERGEIL